MRSVYILAGYIVYSAAIQAMPEPKSDERWYGFFYRFLHLLGVNLKQAGLIRTTGKAPNSEFSQ